jgi:ribose transport system ATP-binding protein
VARAKRELNAAKMTPAYAGLKLDGVAKAFQGVVALRGVNLEVPFGQVHGLIGENGAGKSTLVKILSGKLAADAGSLVIGDRCLSITQTTRRPREGVATAYQELSLIPEWDVATNLLYGVEPQVRAGRVGQRALRQRAKEILEAYDMAAIAPTTPMRELSLADRQVVEILRAVHAGQPVLLLDEPTSALPAGRVEWFYDLVRSFVAPERVVLFISHRLDEVRALCDYVSVLRDGADVGRGRVDEMDEDRLIGLMLGAERGRLAAGASRTRAPGDGVCSLRNFGVPPRLKPVSINVRSGEIVGVAGLEGQGQLDLFLGLFGMRRATGRLEIQGREARLHSPLAALRAGVGLVPQDRGEGLCLPLTIVDNLVMGSLKEVSRFGFLRRGLLLMLVQAAVTAFKIRCRSASQAVSELSGGNQQKVLLAGVLQKKPELLLLYDSTRGVDVGTKVDIFQLVRERAGLGAGVLYYSTDITELLDLADRVLVLHDGQIVADLAHSEVTRERILTAAVGASGA